MTSPRENLKHRLKDLLDDCSFPKMKEFLSGIEVIAEDPIFKAGIEQLLDVICEDRDGIAGFSAGDLRVLEQLLKDGDMRVCTQLITGLVLLATSTPKIKIKYEKNVTEELFLRLLLYILFIELPKIKKGNLINMDRNTKELLIDIIVDLYILSESAQLFKTLIKEFNKLFGANGICQCISVKSRDDVDDIVQDKMKSITSDMQITLKDKRDKIRLEKEIRSMKVDLRFLKYSISSGIDSVMITTKESMNEIDLGDGNFLTREATISSEALFSSF